MASFSIFRRKGDRSTSRRPRVRLREIETLEGRRLLSTTYTVNNSGDYAPGTAPIVDSLRWAITQADTNSGSVIKFDIGKLGTAQTINLVAPLPAITAPVTIDGTSQLGANATTPGIVLNGSHAGSGTDGIDLRANSSTLEGLVVQDFGGYGVVLDASSGDHGDTISGDEIGTNLAGSSAMPNGGGGVVLEAEAYGNTIGGTSASSRDVISGNLGDGVDLFSGAKGNLIEGDYIGVDVSGEHALGNGSIGVAMNTATRNTIGGTTPGARDVISGNGYLGVRIRDGNTIGMVDNVVEGNYIGTDASGLVAIGNQSEGVTIDFGANGNTIGGALAADRNVISGNAIDGVYLSTGVSDQPVSDNVIQGNAIGTNATGTAVLPNKGDGVAIYGSSHNTISGNTISGNALNGVSIGDAAYLLTGQAVAKQFDSSDNLVEGNTIGGTGRAFGNLGEGVEIDSYSTGNTIGGTGSKAVNVISNNAQNGVLLDSDVGANNVFDQDLIDSNGGSGVYLNDATAATTVEDCTIELNAVYGIWMRKSVKLNTATDTVTKNVKGQVVTTSS